MAQTGSSAPARVASVERSFVLGSNTVYAGHGEAWNQEPNFEVKFSEPLAVFEFVKSLSSKEPNNPFKALFISSRFNQEKYQKLIAEFDNLNIDYAYEYTEYAYTGKNAGSTEPLLEKNLINSRTISDFRLSALGIIPNSNLTSYFQS